MDTVNKKVKLATIWLAGCSGCHMSFLDLDEWLFEVAKFADIVYSPVGSDIKDYPENVDVCLVEGAVANEENLELLYKVRQRTKFVISFGDCAVTANVPAMRNMLGSSEPVLKRCYLELGDEPLNSPMNRGLSQNCSIASVRFMSWWILTYLSPAVPLRPSHPSGDRTTTKRRTARHGRALND